MVTSAVVTAANGQQVRVVGIDRPERRNAVDTETAEALHDAFVAFEAGEEPVAVLAGGAEAFCAGADLKDLPRLRPSGPLGPTRLHLSKPVVAAVEGWCVAGGLGAFPQGCVVADRASVYDGLGRTEAETLAGEDERGRAVILAPDFRAGVERFTGR